MCSFEAIHMWMALFFIIVHLNLKKVSIYAIMYIEHGISPKMLYFLDCSRKMLLYFLTMKVQ